MTKAEVEVPRRAVVRLVRFGFEDGERAARLLSDPALGLWDLERNEPADPEAGPVVAALARAGDPDLAAPVAAPAGRGAGLRRHQRRVRGRPAGRACGARACCAAGWSRSSAPAPGWPTTSRPVPRDWTVLDAEGDGVRRGADRPSAVELERQMLVAVGADPDDPPWGVRLGKAAPDASPKRIAALRLAYRRAVLSLAGRDLGDGLPAEEVAAELADIAAAVLTAGLALAVAEQPASAAACRLAVIGLGKCGGRELNYVSDVDVVFVAEPVDPTDAEGPGARQRDPGGRRPHAHLPRGGLGGRRRAAPGGQGRRAGPHRRRARGLLRAVGQHLGVPGAAEDAARSPATPTSAAPTSTRCGRGSGRPATGPASSARCRRCAGGWRPTSRPRRPIGSSSWAAAGCATSSSPSSCCRWCTAGPTRRCASAAPCRR